MKKASLVFGLFCLPALALAADEAYYVGLDTFIGKGEETVDSSTGETTESTNTGGGSINIGYRYSDNDRFEVEFTKVESEFDGSREEKFEGIDFDWSFAVLPQPSFQPYLEAGFGLYEYKGTKDATSNNENLGGIAVNFGLGVIYELEKEIELDASYRIKGIGWEETKDDDKVKEDIGKFVLGARILF